MKVTKFGGSSLANAFQIQKVCDIVLSDDSRRIMVVSAPGKRTKDDTKVTDLLIAVAEARLSGRDYSKELSAVLARYIEIADELNIQKVIPSIEEKLIRICKADFKDNVTYTDSVKAMGEDCCAQLVAYHLNAAGHPAKYCDPWEYGLFLEHDAAGKAVILDESYDNLSRLKEETDTINVFPGFYGYSKNKEIITFSRGGSDITGSILAAAVDAEVYENWTDVDNVFAVNPNIVKNPFPITEITYDEMRELSYAGFTVLHEEAIYPVFSHSIPLNIKNTNNPSAKGTWIVAKRTHFDSLVTGIAGESGFATVTVNKYLMNHQVGFLASLLGIFADEGIAIDHIPSGIDTVTIVLRKKYFTKEKEDVIVRRIEAELGAKCSVEHDLAIVMIVGQAMANSVGIMARAASALSNAGINLRIVNQGASEISMMFGLSESYCSYAVRVLYKELFRY
ncbi:MAG: aspartate kinase [Mageeibacillus sp.]|jgi:aspartate kinase|nr:aspartate kinase [Mageeibacillus sp.]MCI1264618.1 aspartate kinase [Saccharofermentans sp.]MCI1770010.1 aspartate kinase [Mageeibacillus sp.]